ncbi:unnamed protein product [marine sediment metagenome]|uniref:HTH cro/C1-type domain-containing protein n=1 Tax=marine sediment metagenome TaxID=412755 RepID=X0WFR4_9ZZZZ
MIRKAVAPGDAVRAFRKAHSLTQIELGRLTGIDTSTISRIETDRYSISVMRALLIAQVFGISPQSILLPEGYKHSPGLTYKLDKVKERAKCFFERKVKEK